MFGWWQKLPPQLFESPSNVNFIRMRTQSIPLAQDFIVDGLGFASEWLESSVASGGKRYAAFDIPPGFYMALDSRLLNPSAEEVYYRVYPEGTYTLGAAKVDDATNYAKTRNLRQDSGLVQDPLVRYNMTVPPAVTDALPGTVIAWGEPGSSSGNKASGNLVGDNTFLLLNPNQQFALELEDGGAGPVNIQLELVYAFIPESNVRPSAV